jgi:hypothetical protein
MQRVHRVHEYIAGYIEYITGHIVSSIGFVVGRAVFAPFVNVCFLSPAIFNLHISPFILYYACNTKSPHSATYTWATADGESAPWSFC